MELRKQWNDGSGDVLTATYQGEGNEEVPFSSDLNEGVDRAMQVTFKVDENVYAERNVVQEGMREVFNASDGDFILADGETFNVLKDGI